MILDPRTDKEKAMNPITLIDKEHLTAYAGSDAGSGHHAQPISPSEWQSLQELAEQSGFPREQVSLLRWRTEYILSLEADAAARTLPTILFVGQASVLELLLARWLGPETDAAWKQRGQHPLGITQSARLAIPKGRVLPWPICSSKCAAGCQIIVAGAQGKLAPTLQVQLGLFGYIDQVVVVTRLGQPLNLADRELLQSLVGLAATVRVLAVALPNEELGPSDSADLAAYAKAQTLNGGFTFGQYGGVTVWYTDGEPRPGAAANLQSLCQVAPGEVEAGRKVMVRQAQTQLAEAVCRQAASIPAMQATGPTAEVAAISTEEVERLAHELDGFLASVGQKLAEESVYRSRWGADQSWTNDHVRSYALDLLRGWETHTGLEGMWVRYVQRVRPAVWPALLEEARRSQSLIELETAIQEAPRPKFEWTHTACPVSRPNSMGGVWSELAMLLAKRLVVALIIGMAAYWLAGSLMGYLAAKSTTAINSFGVTLVANLALLAGGLLGYGLGRSLFPASVVTPAASDAAAPESRPLQTTVAVKGWSQVAQRVHTAFVDETNKSAHSPLELCRAVAERLQQDEAL